MSHKKLTGGWKTKAYSQEFKSTSVFTNNVHILRNFSRFGNVEKYRVQRWNRDICSSLKNSYDPYEDVMLAAYIRMIRGSIS